ncbi:chromate efflux transporter [Stenotrophomonas sp.]|uniref:chromate efflux transporter n=1 Tax=Stenotrophomonas sp. TaxID=69392 RepID=UPI0028A61DDC|nr:chromate efflux transporter [Stenotrophomonas sp.]
MSESPPPSSEVTTGPPFAGYQVPHESLLALFLRFLRFGCLAWGGPVAQIGMIRQALVDDERWVSSAQFNRALAIYQVLPGPEAHELCVYFGMLARGRIGGILAGLGFMLPGFVLMFILSWAYVRFGLKAEAFQSVFAAVQVAVAALIVRATFRIGGHVITDRWLLVITILGAFAQMAGIHFAILLAFGGLTYAVSRCWKGFLSMGLLLLAGCVIGLVVIRQGGLAGLASFAADTAPAWSSANAASTSIPTLFASGLKAGLLTFGGAYTVIPFLQRDAVIQGEWISNAQFLDGIALSGLLPAPLIIFSTFIGYLAGGPWGAVAMTTGIFLPAFLLTLLGHNTLERLVSRPRIQLFLEGVTAAVVGLIIGTAVALLHQCLNGVAPIVLFSIATAVLFKSKARLVIPAVIVGAALWGWGAQAALQL